MEQIVFDKIMIVNSLVAAYPETNWEFNHTKNIMGLTMQSTSEIKTFVVALEKANLDLKYFVFATNIKIYF